MKVIIANMKPTTDKNNKLVCAMNKLLKSEERLANVEAPFTELFSFLKRYEITHGHPTLAYGVDELKAMGQHIDNAMAVLLQGLQDLGLVTSMISQDEMELMGDSNHIGFLITAISNLTEALNSLRLDTSYSLLRYSKIKD
jgi:hypothetical protein